MAEKRNEIIEEQRRAREEFLKLKKMQQGEIEPEAQPSEAAMQPKTFSGKWQNYWYHFKIQTIFAIFLIVVVAVTTVQCATREKYDFSILYFVYAPAFDFQLDKVEEYFEAKATDINGDGKVNINVINCSVNPKSVDANYRNTMLTKVQAVITAEETTVLYIIDESAQKYFENGIGSELFAEQPLSLGKDFSKKIGLKENPLPENLMLALRKIKGTTFESRDKAKATFTECQKMFNEMKKQNS